MTTARYSEVREGTAYAHAVCISTKRCPKRIRLFIIKLDVVVGEVENCLYPWPAKRGRRKFFPGEVSHMIGIAIATAE